MNCKINLWAGFSIGPAARGNDPIIRENPAHGTIKRPMGVRKLISCSSRTIFGALFVAHKI